MRIFNFNLSHSVLLTLLVSLLVGCSLNKDSAQPNQPETKLANGEGNNDRQLTRDQLVIQNIATSVVLKTYRNLAMRAAALRDHVQTLAENRTQTHLDRAQQLWRECRVSWEQTEGFLFGPVDSLSIDPSIDTWPLNRTELDEILLQSSAISAATIRTIGNDLKGFHTAEYLLFGNGEVTNTKSVASMTLRELEYLVAVTVVLAEDTQRLAHAWETSADPDEPSSEPYVKTLMNPGASNRIYPSEQAVFAEFINGITAIADELATSKIAGPLGASVEEAQPEAEESPFSWNSIADFASNMRSIEMVYSGVSPDGKAGPGLAAIVETEDEVLAKDVRNQIEVATAAIEAIPGESGMPFGKAILDPSGRTRVKTAHDEILKLSALLRERLLPHFANR